MTTNPQTALEKIIAGLMTIAKYDSNANVSFQGEELLVASEKTKSMKKTDRANMRAFGFTYDGSMGCWNKIVH